MTTACKISVLLADDHVVVRKGLASLLISDGHFVIVGEAETGREAVRLALNLRPDVVLMDIAMPLLNGLEATRQILAANPDARIVVLSAHTDDEYIRRMMTIGVVGFLEKQTSAELLSKALREVVKGGTFYSPVITRRLHVVADGGRERARDGELKPNGKRLTTREAEVLQLVAEGLANKQIAATLSISIKTVEKHRQHLMEKLNIHETAGLTRYAIAAGVIEGGVSLTIL